MASKSTKSVSKSKTRALAHRASIDSKFVPGKVIGPPAVRPPPPPKAPTRAPVMLLEAQRRSGGSSPSMEGQAYLLSSPKLRRPWVRHLSGTAASKGPSTQRRCQLLRASLPAKFRPSGLKLPTVRAKVRIREPKTSVSWRPHPQANQRSLMKEVLSWPVLALHHGSAGSDFAPLRSKGQNSVEVLVTWVWLRQANTPPGLAARRAEARQSYMGGSNLVSPSPC